MIWSTAWQYRRMALRFASAVPTVSSDLRFEPRPQRIRVARQGRAVAETTDAYLVWEPRRIVPLYAIPRQDFLVPLDDGNPVTPDLDAMPQVLPPGRFGAHSCSGRDVVVDGLVGHAFQPDDPDLGGRVILDFSAFSWREEDLEMVGHPHDPFKRIDLLPSSRHVTVSLGGVLLADSRSPMMLLETSLPVRWYLPRSDVRLDVLTRTETRTTCAYKGHASYWSYEPASDAGRDIAWTYEDPLHEVLPIKDLMCFFVERTDIVIDGVPQRHPTTEWSRAPGQQD